MIGSDLNEAESFALLDQVYELGGNTLDTAHVYAGGQSERIIGNWLQARNLREKMVIITKGGAHSEDRRRMTPFDITADLFDSLARLKTDHIDLYLLHRDDPNLPVEPIINALNEHQQAGRIRNIHLNRGLLSLKSEQSKYDRCIYYHGNVVTGVYIDDCLLIAPSDNEIFMVYKELQSKFEVSNKGPIYEYLGAHRPINP